MHGMGYEPFFELFYGTCTGTLRQCTTRGAANEQQSLDNATSGRRRGERRAPRGRRPAGAQRSLRRQSRGRSWSSIHVCSSGGGSGVVRDTGLTAAVPDDSDAVTSTALLAVAVAANDTALASQAATAAAVIHLAAGLVPGSNTAAQLAALAAETNSRRVCASPGGHAEDLPSPTAPPDQGTEMGDVKHEAVTDSDCVTCMICLEDKPRAQCTCPLSPVERASSSSSASSSGCEHHVCLACVRQWMAEEISTRQPVVGRCR